MEVRICYLYPEMMSLYGDRGNVLALVRRAEWRGIAVVVEEVGVGEATDFSRYDIAFVGGGQDREQALIAEDFARRKREDLLAAVEEGLPLLAVCGGYQLLGRFYRTADGQELPGVGLFDAWTVAGAPRLIGNVVVESDLFPEGPRTIVGFENHAGRTYLGAGAKPLGRVVVGHGNNGEDGWEGAVYKNAVGTYLHGPLLPKNPALADWLLRAALARRYGREDAEAALARLDDAIEEEAHRAAIRRAQETAANGAVRRSV